MFSHFVNNFTDQDRSDYEWRARRPWQNKRTTRTMQEVDNWKIIILLKYQVRVYFSLREEGVVALDLAEPRSNVKSDQIEANTEEVKADEENEGNAEEEKPVTIDADGAKEPEGNKFLINN